jgi:ribosomal protein L32
MKKIWPWIVGLAVILLVGVMVLFGTGLLRSTRTPMYWFNDGDRAIDGGYWGYHGMGMHSTWGLPVMGLFGGLLMLIFPLGILALIVLGVILLVRALRQPEYHQTPPVVEHCENCGKKVAPDWTVCPYCGEPLGKV